MIIMFLWLFVLTSCSAMPQIFDDVEKVMTDDCITIKVDREAFQRDTDVKITVDVINKEKSTP